MARWMCGQLHHGQPVELAGTRSRNPALTAAYAAERQQIQAELKTVWKELEDTRFSAATTREILRLRKMDAADRRELETTVAL
ncbi:GapR family DNA-binding domain-containing protein [Azospirillum sp. A29]|uniref:GapR family DNA-binding domain-containing protein n=1 Tax=Azospirillum sp. A29 TaxID=3160606 RepID=UPI00367050F4